MIGVEGFVKVTEEEKRNEQARSEESKEETKTPSKVVDDGKENQAVNSSPGFDVIDRDEVKKAEERMVQPSDWRQDFKV